MASPDSAVKTDLGSVNLFKPSLSHLVVVGKNRRRKYCGNTQGKYHYLEFFSIHVANE